MTSCIWCFKPEVGENITLRQWPIRMCWWQGLPSLPQDEWHNEQWPSPPAPWQAGRKAVSYLRVTYDQTATLLLSEAVGLSEKRGISRGVDSRCKLVASSGQNPRPRLLFCWWIEHQLFLVQKCYPERPHCQKKATLMEHTPTAIFTWPTSRSMNTGDLPCLTA